MLGLSFSGKSTLLYKIKEKQTTHKPPTIGFSVETVEYQNLTFTLLTVGTSERLRPLLRMYYQDAQALIFVVDASDWERLETAREELHTLLNDEELKVRLVMVLANKQDWEMGMTVGEVGERLALHSIRGRNWHIQGTCGITGEGLFEGLEWISNALSRKFQA
jgi:ADP-ribosylation factor protein 1